ncbi:MAG: hypothetical protein IJ570_07505 [Prevotella sp.]|nr:hypothetical protein [Prevotella sp.]
MRRIFVLALSVLSVLSVRAGAANAEQQMQDALLQMLARFTEYMKGDFQPCQEPNSVGEACGCFRSNNTMKSNEDGVRSNADLGMVCAFLVRYAKGKVALPEGVSWQDVELMARQSLVFAYSTHMANRLKVCADGRYWGSVSERDHTWESSLWAMSVAFQTAFLWDSLTAPQRNYVHQLLRAECNYELERLIPTGYRGDTKAEENGWEADVLAAALGLFSDDELAPRWRERMLEFAVNSYSHPTDVRDTTIVTSGGRRVCDLFRGANLYEDYTLQNHNYFHTSYQNVVIQELGEAALALNLRRDEPIGTGMLWHCREVCDSVLYWLALSDGELAMPNGNDWSLFLYDQLTSYSTMACLLRDPDALMLERRAFEMIRHRQQTTPDGSWLLRSDIGARRMGVEAHRVMMTWLMHHAWPTADLQPSSWDDFRQRYSEARLLPCQRVVRASTPDCFTCFSWSEGLKSYTGYIAPHLTPDFRPEASNLIVPFKAHNTGNLLGWYEVEGCRINAVPAEEPVFHVEGDVWSVEGHLLCNDSALDLRFTLRSTAGNALIYKDEVRALKDVTILREKGGLLAISEDELTSMNRHYTFGRGYVNIDNAFGVVVSPAKKMMVDRPQNNNSVLTALLYASYDDQPRHYRKGEVVDCRSVVYYADVTAEQTARLAAEQARTPLPAGTPAR